MANGLFRNIGYVKQKILSKAKSASGRSVLAFKHILISLASKSISLIVPILVVPLTISYINPIQYGIWMAISSIIASMSIFDLGLGNGLRNKYAESIANGDVILARKYVSTAYISLSVFMLLLFILFIGVNFLIDWTKILNVDPSYRVELQKVFAILITYFCLNLVCGLFTTILNADQKPGFASLVHSMGQLSSLVAIFILTKVSEGSLVKLSIYFSSIPCIVLILISTYSFKFTKYRAVSPSYKYFDFSLVKNILNLGIQFFVINVSIVLIFQVINIVLSREIGPLAVTQYNLTQRYFSILTTIITVVTVPFWSAFTDAYTQRDFNWMKSMLHKLEICCGGFVLLALLLLVLSNWFYNLWIGDAVTIPFSLSLAMMLFTISAGIENVYIYIINGIGKIRIQLIIYVIFAIFSWPLLTYFCRVFGVYGALFVPTAVYIVLSIFARMQINRLLNNTATGIWGK